MSAKRPGKGKKMVRKHHERKLRAPNNRIGDRGEKRFDAAASDYGLLATKVANDYGIDFVCQVDSEPMASTASGLLGSVVGVCVRATVQESGRIKLNRADAHHLLQANFPTMVALVHLDNGEGESVYVRVLDLEFRKELGAFLQSAKQTISFTPADFSAIAAVQELLAPVLLPGFIQQSRIAAIMAGLEKTLPGVRVDVAQSGEGTFTLVSAENLFSVLASPDTSGTHEHDARFVAAFGAPHRLAERMAALEVEPTLLAALDGLPQDLVVQGFASEYEAEWVAEAQGARSAITLAGTATPTHNGWRHPAGWSLIISKRVLRDGQYVHELTTFVDPDGTEDPGQHMDLLGFLRSCTSEAKVGRASWGALVLDAWAFDGLPRQSRFADWLLTVLPRLPEDSVIATLPDLADDETMRTLWWLASVLEDPESPAGRVGFMLDGFAGEPDTQSRFSVPVLLSTARASIVADLTCTGRIALDDARESIVGVRIDRVDNVELFVDSPFEQPTGFPDFVFDRELCIALTDSGWDQGTAPDGLDQAFGLRLLDDD